MPRPLVHRFKSWALALSAAVAFLFMSAPPAPAYEPVEIVHTEQVQVGPYHLTVGFSTWPLRAMQSLDFTFIPEGGIAGKSGILTQSGPGGEVTSQLSRHPRKRDVWGLDVKSLNQSGDWTFTFDIDGPEGHATGSLRDLPVLAQPGPPLALSWGVCALPALGMIAFVVVAWFRSKPVRTPMALRS